MLKNILFKNIVFKNSAWLIGSKIVQSLLSLIVGMISSRYLGPSNYGILSYASSIVTFMVPFMNIGINEVLVHQIVKKPKDEGKIIGTSIVLCLCSSVLCIIGIFAFVLFANAGEKDTIIVCMIYSLLLIFQIFEMLRYWFQAKLMSKYIAIASMIAYVMWLVYKILLLILGKDVRWFAMSHVIDHMFMAVILIFMYKRMGGQRLSFSLETAKELLSVSKYYIIPNVMISIFSQTDKIMLNMMLNSESVGYYSAATTISGLSLFVFTAILDSFRPIIFEKKEKDIKAYEKNVSLLSGIIIYLSLLQSVAITVLAPIIVRVLYGEAFLESVSTLQIVVWYTTFSYLGAVRNIWILAENKQKVLWILNVSGAVANVIMNFALIPVLGADGAALASLITQFFTNVIMNQIHPDIRHYNKLMFRGLRIISLIKTKDEVN